VHVGQPIGVGDAVPTVVRMRRHWRSIGALLAASVVVVASSPPVAATTTTTGGGSFTGTVTLPFFPCSNCGSGSFTGSVTLSLSGIGTTAVDGVPIPYSATWTAPAPPATNASSPSFGYDETCAAGEPDAAVPLLGTAGGTFNVSGGTLVLATGSIGGATLSGTFNWVRVAAGARLTLSGLRITAPATTAVNLNDTVLLGESGAGFVWSTPAGSCGTQQLNQSATVAGVALQGA
jgi:hypothetical protein